MGNKAAVAEKFGLAVSGPALWRLKDEIDQDFMAQLNTLLARKPAR